MRTIHIRVNGHKDETLTLYVSCDFLPTYTYLFLDLLRMYSLTCAYSDTTFSETNSARLYNTSKSYQHQMHYYNSSKFMPVTISETSVGFHCLLACVDVALCELLASYL